MRLSPNYPRHPCNPRLKSMDNELLQQFFEGDTRALARIITRVENRSADSLEILQQLFPRTGKAEIIGVTGSPGSGKSTLVDRLAVSYRQKGKKLGIIAVDPRDRKSTRLNSSH